MRARDVWCGMVLVGAGLLAGCRVERSTHDGGDKFEMETPVGNVRVKTNGAAAAMGVGLPVYPGATVVEKKDDGSGAADVDLSLGALRVRVKAVSYRTGDSPGDVEAFYRRALRSYGTVIACRDDRPVGEPERTAEGLKCDKGRGPEVEAGSLELRAGSSEHRHEVGIEGEGAGTKFALVMLDLPKGMGSDGGSD